MATIYIVPIEPIDQRYTKQWYDNIPLQIEQAIKDNNLNHQVITIDGESIPANTSTGAFLDFGATNIYKASQTQRISELFSAGKINSGDKFLITDAWNFVITAIRYMSDLLDIPVEIHSIWHAGAYDPTDILGYKMQKPWPWHQERSWYYASDYNYYATDFHRQMFLENLNIEPEFHNKAVRSGQPHTLIIEPCSKLYQEVGEACKTLTIIWPHRYNADKQPEIAEHVAKVLQDSHHIPMVFTQKLNLSKQEYYLTLSSMSVIFSCALHENLGISVMEAVLAGVIPVLPDRCSYQEMYLPEFKYPAEWTASYEQFLEHERDLLNFILDRMHNREKYLNSLKKQREILVQDYLQPTVMIEKILQ